MTATRDRVPFGIKVNYGVGAIAYGIKENGFSTFLLLFYNQVIGLPAGLVGAVIAVALIFDAMIDPMLGVLSDRTRSRWGRRHPWLYASALPIALTWLLLWNPPQGSQSMILAWLLVTAVLARAAIATNEVPSLALAPELTRDYHERTRVMRYRYLLAWSGGLVMLVLAYSVFLAPPLGATSGPLAMGGFHYYALAGAIAMAVAVLWSALGTHRFVMALPNEPVPRMSFKQTLEAARHTLGNRGFGVLMIGGACTYTSQGVSFSLSNYNLAFVWGFGSSAFVAYALMLMAGVTLAFFFVTPLSHRLGKVHCVAILTVTAATLTVTPYTLRLLGLFPDPGSPQLLPMFMTINLFSTACSVGGMIIGASMMSDVVEASEEKTGRREEGLFFAGALFMQKCASGIGIFLTGQILALAAFPDNAVVGSVPVHVIDKFTLLFLLVYLGLNVLAAIAFLRFPFGKAEHDVRLAKLAVAASEFAVEKG